MPGLSSALAEGRPLPKPSALPGAAIVRSARFAALDRRRIEPRRW